jgi:hypothetical protein
VLLVNPASQNREAAMKLVEFVAKHLAPDQRVEMMPGENNPVRDLSLNLTWLEESIAQTQDALGKADPADRQALEAQLESRQREYEEQKRYEWLVTDESIAALRALDAYFVLEVSNPVFGMEASQEVTDLMYGRFIGGQMSVEQFLGELDRKLRMIEMEG